jgi:leucyl aminopeptidase (aminopeptidase T)
MGGPASSGTRRVSSRTHRRAPRAVPSTPSKLQRDVARVIVTKYLRVRPGEHAIIESWNHTMPLATAMVDEVRRAGAKALFLHESEDAWWRAIDRKQSRLLSDPSAPEWAALKAADVYVNFWGPGDTNRIERLPERTFEEAFDWNSYWYDAARKTGLRGARMTAGFVTPGRARQWGIDLTRWEESTLRASLIDPDELAKSGARLGKALARGTKVRITHPNGTDLEVALAGGAARVLDGRPHPRDQRYGPSGMLSFIPAGVVDVALDSRTAEGVFRANRRTNIWWNWNEGGTFEFRGGKLTSYSFEQGEEEFVRQYRSGSAGKDRASALTFGLNPAVRDVPNLEKIELGGVSLQIGRNQYLGGSNHSSFFTWITLADSEIAIDGTPVVRAGRLL